MSTKSEITEDEKCAICGKRIRVGSAFVLYWSKKRGGVWHPKCGPLPSIPGLTSRR